MAWPPTNHGELEDAVTAIRSWFAPPTGMWITAPGAIGTVSGTFGVSAYMPMFLPAGTVADVSVRVSTASTAASGGTVQLGIYDTSGTAHATWGRVPGTLLATGAAISTETTGVKTLTINQSITGGLYWLAALPLVATASFSSASTDSVTGRTGLGTSNALSASVPTLTSTTTQTSLPSSSPTVASGGTTGIRVFCSFSSVS